MITPVILCGGSGSRLWPLSRQAYPKQLLPLIDEETMLQLTLRRTHGNDAMDRPLLLCNDMHRFMVAEQVRAMGVTPETVILEPMGRNTAPAVAVAAHYCLEKGTDPVLLVLPADHHIRDVDAFRAAVSTALPVAEDGHLLTFGVTPASPHTGYGYIKSGDALSEGVYRIERFVEKPDLATATSFLESGEYSWNSGMFMFKASSYLKELETHSPDTAAHSREALQKAVSDLDFIRLDADAFAACPNDSVDYAVMEKTTRSAVAPMDAGWSDLGSWESLYEAQEKDANGNVIMGDIITHNVSNSYLRTESRMLAATGVENMVVVETKDAVMVAPRDKVQDVKVIVDKLKAGELEAAVHHTKVYRPWGSFESIDAEDRFQVKRLSVKPGATLSLQKHHHRAEHWIVVKGTAEVTRDEEVLLLSENESIYIPLGAKHRLSNPGKVDLEIIEVQSGSYLGEDDIVRFEDFYGRKGRND